MKYRYLFSYFLLLTSYFLLLSPDLAQAMPWSKDMFTQPSSKAQEESTPSTPEGIVPTRGRERPLQTRVEASAIQNPVEPGTDSIARGKILYNIYCAVCHGETGTGNGTVGRKFILPTDLASEYVQTKPDGDIYFTITHGGLFAMPGYGDAIPSEDRWHIINYVKKGLTGVKGQGSGGVK